MSMIVELTGFGGEHPLNFRILGGSCPETAKENTIWVDAGDVKHWVFSSSQPEAAAEGMIWIATGLSSLTPFNALKRNTLMLQPLTAKRFSGGAWEEMDAKIYHGGWKRFWNGLLYRSGDEFIPVTGGWEAYFDSEWYSRGNFSKKADRITLSGGDMTFMAAKCANALDLTHFKTIEVKLENVSHAVIHLSVVEEGKSFNANHYVADTSVQKTAAATLKLTLDISTLKGKFQVGCSSAGGMSAAHSMDIVEVTLL